MAIGHIGKKVNILAEDEILASRYNEFHTQKIRLDRIRVNAQPRNLTQGDSDSIVDLAESIRENGLLQPIVVMEDSQDKTVVHLIAGERRFRAYQWLKHSVIPAIVRPFNSNDAEILTHQLIENIHREELSIIEKADALYALKHRHHLSMDDMEKRTRLNRKTVWKYLAIARLTPEQKAEITRRKLSQKAIEQAYLANAEKSPAPSVKADTSQWLMVSDHTQLKIRPVTVKFTGNGAVSREILNTLASELEQALQLIRSKLQ